MADGLYERDALAWAEQQASLLRRLAAGESINAAVDWPNVIEEVQDVGLSELRAARSLLGQAMTHLLKLQAWPMSTSARQRRDEIGTFLDGAEDHFTSSMRQRIELDEIYAKSLRRARASEDASGPPLPLSDICPVTLDDLLRGDVPVLAAKLAASTPAGGRTG